MVTAILVGVPDVGRLPRRIESHTGDRITIHCCPARVGRGCELDSAKQTLSILNGHDHPVVGDKVVVLVLPYAFVPGAVQEKLSALAASGIIVKRPAPNSDDETGAFRWPSRPKSYDQTFQEALLGAICKFLDYHFPPNDTEADLDHRVAYRILKALVTHNKMGRNNHSHEDDLWKSAQDELQPADRKRILRNLLDKNILCRKKNASMGGTGWVYWIEDVQGARALCPGLAPYLGS